MLKIRLARGGAKKRPYYYIVVADSHSPRDGRFIAQVGTYNPLLKKDDPKRVTLKTDEIKAWLNSQLGHHERVDQVVVRLTLPKTLVGKLSRKELVAEVAAETVLRSH